MARSDHGTLRMKVIFILVKSGEMTLAEWELEEQAQARQQRGPYRQAGLPHSQNFTMSYCAAWASASVSSVNVSKMVTSIDK